MMVELNVLGDPSNSMGDHSLETTLKEDATGLRVSSTSMTASNTRIGMETSGVIKTSSRTTTDSKIQAEEPEKLSLGAELRLAEMEGYE